MSTSTDTTPKNIDEIYTLYYYAGLRHALDKGLCKNIDINFAKNLNDGIVCLSKKDVEDSNRYKKEHATPSTKSNGLNSIINKRKELSQYCDDEVQKQALESVANKIKEENDKKKKTTKKVIEYSNEYKEILYKKDTDFANFLIHYMDALKENNMERKNLNVLLDNQEKQEIYKGIYEIPIDLENYDGVLTSKWDEKISKVCVRLIRCVAVLHVKYLLNCYTKQLSLNKIKMHLLDFNKHELVLIYKVLHELEVAKETNKKNKKNKEKTLLEDKSVTKLKKRRDSQDEEDGHTTSE